MEGFLKKVRNAIGAFSMLREGDRVIAAVSGGPDSVCLLHCLVELAPECGIELLAAHFNHKLRGEDSDRDEQFVEGLCKRLNVPLSLAREDMAAVGSPSR